MAGVNEAKVTHNCPHCNEPTISKWQKLNSGPLFPAKCKKCNGLSAIERKSSLLWLAVFTTVPILFILPIFEFGILIPAICYLTVILAGLNLIANHSALIAIEGRNEN